MKKMVHEYYDLSDPVVRDVLLKHYQSELAMTQRTLVLAQHCEKKAALKDWVATLKKQEQEILTAIEDVS